MSNVGQALTHQLIARKAAAMLVEQNTVVANMNTDREVGVRQGNAGLQAR
jgi:hypothetical protein